MRNFTFYTPTKVFFGKDTHKDVGKIVRGYGFQRVLVHYGQGSVKKTGLLDVVLDSLKSEGITVFELGGVEPNPKISLAREGIALCKAERIELVLAVGGGSAIDSAKSIAVGAMHDNDPWDFFERKAKPQGALPVATILTLAASGSEMSASCVMTNSEGHLKRGCSTEYNRPLFSILNPELTFTVSPYQTACGAADMMMHTIERYFSNGEDTPLTDRMAEALLKSVIEAAKVAIANPEDYEARATLMWAGSLAHNDLTGCGRDVFMPCHQMEHELSGMYDRVSHGAGLCVVFPAWAKYVYRHNIYRFAQYAVRVWNCEMNFEHPEQTALEGIQRTEEFFQSIGMPVRLSELKIGSENFDEMAEKCTFFGTRVLKNINPLGKKEILDVFRLMQ